MHRRHDLEHLNLLSSVGVVPSIVEDVLVVVLVKLSSLEFQLEHLVFKHVSVRIEGFFSIPARIRRV